MRDRLAIAALAIERDREIVLDIGDLVVLIAQRSVGDVERVFEGCGGRRGIGVRNLRARQHAPGFDALRRRRGQWRKRLHGLFGMIQTLGDLALLHIHFGEAAQNLRLLDRIDIRQFRELGDGAIEVGARDGMIAAAHRGGSEIAQGGRDLRAVVGCIAFAQRQRFLVGAARLGEALGVVVFRGEHDQRIGAQQGARSTVAGGERERTFAADDGRLWVAERGVDFGDGQTQARGSFGFVLEFGRQMFAAFIDQLARAERMIERIARRRGLEQRDQKIA